jgi:hypothetical protein
MVAHPLLEDVSPEETTKLLLPDLFVENALSGAKERLAPNLYEPPVAEVEHVERETESYVAWVIVLGFVAYALALYWADRCNRRGGDPVIRFSVIRGFGVRYTVRKHTHAYPFADEVARPRKIWGAKGGP